MLYLRVEVETSVFIESFYMLFPVGWMGSLVSRPVLDEVFPSFLKQEVKCLIHKLFSLMVFLCGSLNQWFAPSFIFSYFQVKPFPLFRVAPPPPVRGRSFLWGLTLLGFRVLHRSCCLWCSSSDATFTDMARSSPSLFRRPPPPSLSPDLGFCFSGSSNRSRTS